MRLTFLGATGTVTGSRYLLEAVGQRVLVDCGLFQGVKQLRRRNWEPFPVDPSSIDAVVLTSAHRFHAGYLPRLIRSGFRGPVYCSAVTAELCRLLLPGWAVEQEEEAERAAREGFSRHPTPEPLYTGVEAGRALEQLEVIRSGGREDLGPGLSLQLRSAGYLAGASTASFATREGTVLLSGSLGRADDPIHYPPAAVCEAADVIVVESTLGGRRHDIADPMDRLAELIGTTTARGGSVLIPADLTDRAQGLIYLIQRLKTVERLPAALPLLLDSPLAEKATGLFLAQWNQTRLFAGVAAAVARAAEPISRATGSERVSGMLGPRIIVASGGRALCHLVRMAPDPRNSILLVGEQIPGTRGAELVAGAREVKIRGSHVPVRAEVASLPNSSGHADARQIVTWLSSVPRGSAPAQVFVTQGEPAAADSLRRRIQDELGWPCRVPDYRERVLISRRRATLGRRVAGAMVLSRG